MHPNAIRIESLLNNQDRLQDETMLARKRVDGAPFRRLAEELILRGVFASRWALSNHLVELLSGQGIDIHVRTLRRQLSGRIASIPPLVDGVMHALAGTHLSDEELAGLSADCPDDGEELARYVPTTRLKPLAVLWLYLNPGGSQRGLGRLLAAELGKQGLDHSANYLEALLGGRRPTARVEVLEALLARLEEAGVPSEAAALRQLSLLDAPIAKRRNDQELTTPYRFWLLCLAWQLRHRQLETTQLAEALSQRLEALGLSASLEQLQRAIMGHTARVRRAYLTAAEGLLSDDLGPRQTVDRCLGRWHARPGAIANLLRVDATPLVELTQMWLEVNPGATRRQLARDVCETIESMGYQRSLVTVYAVLSGRAKQTRGLVYRATLAQLGNPSATDIPELDFREPAARLQFLLAGRDHQTAELHQAYSEAAFRDGMAARFLCEARAYLPGARHPQLAAFLAFRAERLFGLDSRTARALLDQGEPLRSPSGISEIGRLEAHYSGAA